MTQTAEIDVLLPVYNAADTLEATLESLAAQTFTDFRVLAIDDGSTDRSGAILQEWASKDSHFHVITQANAGIVAALNRGLAEAHAPLIARIDGDDLCHPSRFAIQRDYLAQNEEVVAIAGRVEHIDENGQPIAGLPHPGDPEEADFNRIPAMEPYLIHPFLMARRQAMVSAGGYRYVPHSEDSDLYWRLREVGRLYNLPDIMGQYRFHMASISGGSILNGRIMAVGSQLGATAARIRASGGPAPDFADNLVPALKAATLLEAMCELAGELLPLVERPQFRLAAAIKLLELGAYRPYEVELDDCRFVRSQLATLDALSLPGEIANEVRWHLGETAARLLRSGRIRDALALAPPSLWPTAMAKSVLKRK